MEIIAPPEGSGETIMRPMPQTVASQELANLEHGASTSILSYSNEGMVEFADVTIHLKPITPLANASVQLINEELDKAYEIPMTSDSLGARVISFKKIPCSFLNNFVFKNLTGSKLAPMGDYIVVSPCWETEGSE
jgi:hypothetical protein